VYAGLDDRGRRMYTTRTVKGGKREAQRALRAFVDEVESGGGSDFVDKGKAPITVGALMEHWMLHADWSPATRAGNVQCVKDWIVPHIGDVRLDRLTLWRIETFYRTLRTEGGRDGGPLSVGSVKRTHSVLHAALGEAVRWRFLQSNPATGARRPKGDDFEAVVPGIEDIRRVMDAAPEHLRVIIALAISTGARRGELLALRWSDIDTAQNTVSISRSVNADGSLKSTKTKATGVVSVGGETMALVSGWRGGQEHRWAEVGKGPMPADMWVFPSAAWDRPLRVDSISHQWRALADQEGMEGVRFHDLRHATATHLVANGVDVRTVSGRLRHASTSMTLDVYTAKVTASDVAAGKLLDGLVYGTDGDDT
jgi:integrase